MGRLSHACLLYTTLGVCRTPPLHYPVSRSFPCWDISPHRCYTLRQTGSVWAASPPSRHEAPTKEAEMDIAVAQQFLREHENAVLTTWRRDGRLQMWKRNKKVAVFVLCSLIRGTMEGAMHHGL